MKSDRRFVGAASLSLALVAFLWLFPELDDVGVTWDEPQYYSSVARIQEWTRRVVFGPDRLEALEAEAIGATWDVDRYWNPHPPVYKEAMAVSEALLGERFGSLVGYRAASLFWFCTLLGGVVWFAGTSWGLVAGIGAGLSLLGMPRLLGHAHIAATDMPLALFWFLASAGFVLFVLHGRAMYLWIAALGLGLAMGTKFTGYLLPVPLLAWLALYGRRRHAWSGLVVWILLALLIAWASNPLAWYGPVGYARQLFSESLGRDQASPIYTYYLGRVWEYVLPWHHAPVMTAITVPVSLLALALVGGGAVVRKIRTEAAGMLCLVQVVFFWFLMALPGSPDHDGVRLFLPLFPFLAVLAGFGFACLVQAGRSLLAASGRLTAGAVTAGAATLLGLLFFYPPYLQASRVAPYYLSYYGELIGGTAGAARAGMEVSYWLDAVTPGFLAKLNETLPQGARLGAHPNLTHYQHLQLYGMIREDIQLIRDGPVSYFILLARKASFEPAHRGIYENVSPVLAVELDGVELAGLYRWSEDVAPDAAEEEQ
jgi:hypothetical protein